jgi:hypothetical protein
MRRIGELGLARKDPLHRLSCNGRDVIEVGVVVQHGRAVVVGYGGGEDANHSGRTMLAGAGHQGLNVASPIADLRDDREINEDQLPVSPQLGVLRVFVA